MEPKTASSPEQIFRVGLNSLKTDEGFTSLSNTGIIRVILRDLYLSTKGDAEFQVVARTFLYLTTDILENDFIAYNVRIGDRGTEIIAVPEREDLYEELRFEYPEILMRERQNWHSYFMEMASRASDRTTCAAGRKVGAVFVKDKVPLMSGFNGVPPNYPHPKVCARIEAGCKSGEGLDKCPCNHAERNAINLASKHGVVLNGSTLYCTARPCMGCMGDLSVAGVRRVIYQNHYPHDITDRIAFYGNIEIVHISEVTNENEEDTQG